MEVALPRETLTYRFASQFTQSEKVKLVALALRHGVSKNTLLRRALVKLYEQENQEKEIKVVVNEGSRPEI